MNYFAASLLAALCLPGLSCPAQTRPPAAVAALSPRPVRLDSGAVVREPMAGFTRPDYEALLAEQAETQRFVLVTTQRLAGDRQRQRTDSLARGTDEAEKQRLRQQVAALAQQLSEADARQARLVSRPLERPFLLNPNTYKGALGGVLLSLVGLVYLHR